MSALFLSKGEHIDGKTKIRQGNEIKWYSCMGTHR